MPSKIRTQKTRLLLNVMNHMVRCTEETNLTKEIFDDLGTMVGMDQTKSIETTTLSVA